MQRNPQEAQRQALLLSAIANKKRLLILAHLSKREIAVGQLAEQVGLSQSALSQHLSKLRQYDLVTTRRDAQTIYYSTTNKAVCKILATLTDIFSDGTPKTSEPTAEILETAATDNGDGKTTLPS